MKYPCDKCSVRENCLKHGKPSNCLKWERWFRPKWIKIRRDFGQTSKWRKWTEDDEIKMWKLWDKGYCPAQIAKTMGISEQQVRWQLGENVTLKRVCKGTVSQCPNEKCEWKQKIGGLVDYCPLNHCIKGER